MENKTEIIKIEATDTDVDNSYYEIKTSYIHTDDYGNSGEFFKKETHLCTEYDKKIEEDLANAQKLTDEANEKKEAIEQLTE